MPRPELRPMRGQSTKSSAVVHWASENLPPRQSSTRSSAISPVDDKKLLVLLESKEKQQPSVEFAGPRGWTAKDMEEEERRDRRWRQRQKVVNCCKKLAAFLFSHIGLASMVVAYSIMGGFIFAALEAPEEVRTREIIAVAKNKTLDGLCADSLAILNATGSLRGDGPELEEFRTKLREVLTRFQEDVRNNVKDKGWDGNDDLGVRQWSFAGALLYAVTVITTIGYGHITPKTDPGRMLTIVYALIGIPLTFLCLSNLGNFLADCFRLFYKRICCDVLCCQKCDRKRRRERLKLRRRREMAAQYNMTLLDSLGDRRSGADGPAALSQRQYQQLLSSPASRPDGFSQVPLVESRNHVQQRRIQPEVSALTTTAGGGGWAEDDVSVDMMSDNSREVQSGRARSQSVSDGSTGQRHGSPDDETSCSQHPADNIGVTTLRKFAQEGRVVKSSISFRSDLDDDDMMQLRETAILDDDEGDDKEDFYSNDDVRETAIVNDSIEVIATEQRAKDDLETCRATKKRTTTLKRGQSAGPADVKASSDNKEVAVLKKNKFWLSSSKSQPQLESNVKQAREELSPDPPTLPPKRPTPTGSRFAMKSKRGLFRSQTVKNDHSPVVSRGIFEKGGAASKNKKVNQSSMTQTRGQATSLRPAADDVDDTLTKPLLEVSPLPSPAAVPSPSSDPSTVVVEAHAAVSRWRRFARLGRSSAAAANDRNSAPTAAKATTSSKDDWRIFQQGKQITPRSRVERTTSLKVKNRSCSADRRATRGAKTQASNRLVKSYSLSREATRLARERRDANTAKKEPTRSTRPAPAMVTAVSPAVKNRGCGGAARPVIRRTHSMESVAELERRRFRRRQGASQGRGGSSGLNWVGSARRARVHCSTESFVTAPSRSVSSDLGAADRNRQQSLFGRSAVESPFIDRSNSSTIVDITGRYDTSTIHTSPDGSTLYRGPGFLTTDSNGLLQDQSTIRSPMDDDPFFNYDPEDEDDDNNAKVTVPISVCLLIIGGYIVAGSALFTLWEDWGYLEGSYFCFITLSTIGFGDIVPGTDMSNWQSNEKLVLCALWLAFGLSLLAMCFNLMQEEVKDKCRWLGQKLGILEDEDSQR